MMEQTAMITLHPAKKVLAPRAALRPALRRLTALAVGFAGGWAVLYGSLAPFGLGLALGAAEDCFAACAAGTALAVLLRGSGLHGVCLLCGLGAAVAVRWLCPRKFGPAAAAGCGVLAVSGLCFASAEGMELALFAGADALLAGAFGWALRRFPPERPGAGTLLTAAAVVCALAEISLGPFVLAAAVCAAVELALCCRGQVQAALTGCAVCGAALCGADPGLACAAAALSCGTAAAAVLAPGRRLEGFAAYAGGCAVGLLCVQPPGDAFALLFSAGAGLGVFWLLPRRWLTPDAPLQDQADAGQSERPRLSAAATRLELAAKSLSSLAETVNDVYDALPHRCESYRWVIDNIHDSLCANCGRCEECWKKEYSSILEGMEALRPILEQQSQLSPQQLPGQLARCIHPAALCAAAGRSFALYRSRKEAHVHSEAMRTALTEQYSAVAEALGVLSEQLGRPGDPEPYKTGRVAAFFTSLGAPPLECAVTLDDLGRTRAAVTLPRTRFSSAELDALAQEVGHICRRPLDTPQKLSCKGMTTLIFCEKPALRAVFGMASAAARGEISGDAVQQFCSPAAAQMILCDGMGTGRPAAVDGNLAAELTARLLKAGFTAELAARLVNVALALKSEEESGATLDLISIDLYTGTARLFKAGAAPGFIVHGGRARAVGEASLPVGILGGVNGQSRVVHLAAGDLAVLVSDGLLVDGTGWVLKQLELSAAAGDAPDKLAQILVETARTRAEAAGRPDDITAAVVRLEGI
ncbi:MAG: SpoIIE family protein phosphatase [Faecalibacterium sp.]